MTSIAKAFSVLGLICTLCLSGAHVFGNPIPVEYGWTISDSPTDPFSNVGVPGSAVLYLHLSCCTVPLDILAAEFDLAFLHGQGEVLDFTPQPPFQNGGGSSNLLLQVDGCPLPPVLAGVITCRFDGPDELCIVPSAMNGVSKTTDCFGSDYPNVTVGYSATGALPTCDDRWPNGELCWYPVSVEGSTWGVIKSLYK